MKIFDVVKMQKRINTLENEVETLQNIIKDELYNAFMSKLNESVEVDRLKKENKKLKLKVKSLKDIIKEDK